MADSKISALTELTTVADADLLAIVDDPSGTPVSKKITKANLVKNIPVSALANGTDGQLITWGADAVATTVATGTSGQVLTSNGAGAAPTFQDASGGGNDISLGWGTLTGGTFKRINGYGLAQGTHDLYTVPAGKKALILPNPRVYTPNAANIASYSAIKVSSTYYQLNTAVTVNASSQSWGMAGILLNEGESFSCVVSTNDGLNVWCQAIEFDDTVNLKQARILSLSNGDNTLLTVPASKVIIPFFSIQTNASINAINVFNASGGTRAYTIYNVPSGGTAGDTNKFGNSTNVNNLTRGSLESTTTMGAGDFLVINTNSADTTQTAWYLYWEVDA